MYACVRTRRIKGAAGDALEAEELALTPCVVRGACVRCVGRTQCDGDDDEDDDDDGMRRGEKARDCRGRRRSGWAGVVEWRACGGEVCSLPFGLPP